MLPADACAKQPTDSVTVPSPGSPTYLRATGAAHRPRDDSPDSGLHGARTRSAHHREARHIRKELYSIVPIRNSCSFTSAHFGETYAQLLRCAEECILRRLFSCVQHLADGPQLESLVMLQFKNHALTRRQPVERAIDLSP